MKLLCWNCRGLGSPRAVRSLHDVIKSHKPQVVSLIETKKTCIGWERLRCSLGMAGCFAVSRIGFSGGLALLWREEVKVNIVGFSRFHIDMQVEDAICFRFTLFYGNPRQEKRGESWKLLNFLSSRSDDPWLVAGDFNEVLFAKESMGKCPRNTTRMSEFREAIRSNGLMDLGYEGSWFTYSNKRKFTEEARARLDRAFANNAWCNKFNRAIVRHGTAITSDHSPIIIDCAGAGAMRAKRQFRYEAMWQLDSSFQNVLHEAWKEGKRCSGSLIGIQRSCANKLEIWNRSSFGNVQSSIRKWKRKLEKIRSCARSEEVIKEERLITTKIDDWLEREEILWKQRSKID